jgi:ankyrin repeat protein
MEFVRQLPVIALEKSNLSEPSFGLGVFEDASDWWPSETLSPIDPPASSSMVKEQPSNRTYHEPLTLLPATLREFAPPPASPEDDPDSLQTHLDLQPRSSEPDPVNLLLKLFMYLSSNNGDLSIAGSVDRTEYNFFDWIMDNLPSAMLDALVSSNTSTAKACIEWMFFYSLIKGKMELAWTLLTKKPTILHELRGSKTNPMKFEKYFNQWGPASSFQALFLRALHVDDVKLVRRFLETAKWESDPNLPLWNAESPEVVQLLMDAGADVNTLHQNFCGGVSRHATASFWATYYGKSSVVQSLIQNNADVNIAATEVGKFGQHEFALTPLHAAVHRVLRYSETWSEHQDAGANGLDLVTILVKGGANIDAPSRRLDFKSFGVTNTNWSATPLQTASNAGHVPLVELLLDLGADVNSTACPGGKTALFAAVEAGHAEVVKILLARGAQVNAFGNHESEPHVTCLMAAVRRGDAMLVQMLLENGADPDLLVVDSFGFSIIEIAEAFSDTSRIVEILVQFGVSRDKKTQERGQLLRAISTGDSTRFSSLLEYGIDFTEPSDYRSKILSAAIDSGNNNALISLVQAGIDINKRIKVDFLKLKKQLRFTPASDGILGITAELICITPLGYAIAHRGWVKSAVPDIAMTMLDLDADLNASLWEESFGYQSLLHFAISQWIGRRNSSYQGIKHVEGLVTPKLIEILLSRGALPGASGQGLDSSNQATPLQLIASDEPKERWPETFEVAEMLLKAGADVNSTQCLSVLQPLEAAAFMGNFDLVKLLLSYGADVKGSALQEAIRGFFKYDAQPEVSMAVVNFLLEKKADINAPPSYDGMGMTALQWAVYGNFLPLVRRLINLGAEINAVSSDATYGGTAIQIAAKDGHLEMAHLLIHHGADVNRASHNFPYDEEETCAIDLAAREGRLDMVQLLINEGADTHLPGSKRYRRAERLAEREGHVAVADLLKHYFEDATWD